MLRMVYFSVWMAIFLTMQCVQCLEERPISEQSSKIKKRSYNPWSVPRFNSLSVYNAGTVFRPATRTIAHPYYIPVYGTGGNYIFYPPQPLYTNPGVPADNPNKIPFKGQPYLPPPPKEMATNNRFGADDDDDAPIWGNEKESAQTTRRTPTSNGNGNDDGPIWGNNVPVPMQLSGSDREKEFTPRPQQSSRPTRPPPPPSAALPARPSLIHESIENQDQNNRLPPSSPSVETPSVTAERSPSNCVWAIISCCSATSPVPPQNCFEQRGCPGPFWGNSPCHSDFARTAIAAAVEYYSRNPGG